MKILLVHPEDSAEVGPWTGHSWDLVVDLGWSGRDAYAELSKRLGTTVFSICDWLDHELHRRKMCEILTPGLNELVDSEAVDWLDIALFYSYQQLEQLMLFSALAEQIPAQAEVFVTRPHFGARALELLLNREIKDLAAKRPSALQERVRHYFKSALALRPSQLAEIAFDKWDTDYNIRRRFAPSTKSATTPTILLPSAYGNVSRAQLAYARMLPHRRFLLAVTRQNGRVPDLPNNVELRSLASYARDPLHATNEECSRLLERWGEVWKSAFAENPPLNIARRLGVFDAFPSFLKNGLRIRDAWREVLNREPITAVLSADENNPYTRLPTLLAKSRRLPTVLCDHGALNMGFRLRRICSDIYLMRDEMARDYIAGWPGVPPERIVVGAPAHADHSKTRLDHAAKAETVRDWIVFYSEAYELWSGRTRSLYSELLPELCSIARQTRRKVVVKLHPFESYRTREAIICKVLTPEQQQFVELRQGPMSPDLFDRAWFSITVESSVAVESTLNGVPCFLCSWFDPSWYDYAKQFAKYSAGYLLDSPRRIREIPELLERFEINEATRAGLQSYISPERLDSILSGA